ncbi:MAG TPA: hypothetical protein VLU23_00405 [Pseudolabrys sp.]|jgi:hypothetical protein|nr:hypothetical protein [Pseudolabrys sp.]
MEEKLKGLSTQQRPEKFDLDTLLHPARAFAHPMDVVRDADLSLNEKRAILASWASDACAIEAAPELRVTAPGNLVPWDDIMDALRALDREGQLQQTVSALQTGARAKRRRAAWSENAAAAQAQ